MGAGFVGGQAKEAGDGRTQAKDDARDLKTAVDAARAKIDDMAQKVEAGAKLLKAPGKERQFPKDLADQPRGDHAGVRRKLLARRRFSGFSKDVSKQLFDFVTSVTALNEHKTAIKNLLTKLAKPIEEQLKAAASGQHSIQYVVLLGGSSGKDDAGNWVANIAQLNPPLTFTGNFPTVPDDIKANFAGQNVGVPKYKGGTSGSQRPSTSRPSASMRCARPRPNRSSRSSGLKMGDLITEIRGERSRLARSCKTRSRGFSSNPTC